VFPLAAARVLQRDAGMSFLGNTYWALRLLPWVAAGAGALLLALAMPGVDFSEGAWFWAVPFLLWASSKPSWRQWLLFSFAASWLVKIATLVWLRHVYPPLGWMGLVLLTAYLALFPAAWLALARWIFPKTNGAPPVARLVAQLGLAGAWVALEWTQGRLFSGFPWVLLAETQWRRPPVLALCQWGGPWAVGFAIMLFNIGVARYVRRFMEEREQAEAERLKALRAASGRDSDGRRPASGADLPPAAPAFSGPLSIFRRMCPEFYLGMAPVFVAFHLFIESGRELALRSEHLFSMAVVQTDFNPCEKWTPELLQSNAATLRRLTDAALRLTPENPVFEMPADPKATLPPEAAGGVLAPPDLLLWPEAALGVPVHSEEYARYVRSLLRGSPTVLLAGGITPGKAPDSAVPGYYNMVFTATADGGPSETFYGKRHLVPFGEYLPGFAEMLGLRKVVPLKSDCLVGKRDAALPVRLGNGRLFQAGALVCYEDVFPDIALGLARPAGAGDAAAAPKTPPAALRDLSGGGSDPDAVEARPALDGADFLCVLTNDAWYGRESGAYQHAAHSAVLAASLRIPVIRCGNNGWSGWFTPSGHAVPLLNAAGGIYFCGAGRFDVRGIPAAMRRPTFYQQNGNWLVTCSFLLFAWSALRLFLARRKKVDAAKGVPS
jgi:apolipoprotein N-acyltransferase